MRILLILVLLLVSCGGDSSEERVPVAETSDCGSECTIFYKGDLN